MERPERIVEDDDLLSFTGEEIYLVLKALDVYAHAMLLGDSTDEFLKVQTLAKYILTKTPKPELNS